MTDEVDKPGARSRANLERALLQQAVVKELKKIADDSKHQVHDTLDNGETLKVSNARGGQLGTIYRTEGKQRAVIVDASVVFAAAVDSGAELEDRLPLEGSPEYWEAVDVLQEHAPHLVRTVLLEQEEQRLAEEVLDEFHRTGDVAEGWRISESKQGYTAIRLAPLGKEIAARMVSQARGVMELEEGKNNGE